MVPASGERFHFALLETVLRYAQLSEHYITLPKANHRDTFSAPMSFFASTDSGVTMNRFSQDLQLIDMELPIAALNTFASKS